MLYAGELVEEGAATEVFKNPRHPYTVGLLRSIPRRDVAATAGGRTRAPLATIPGSLPAPGSVVEGCIFADRCGLAEDRCRTEAPPMYEIGGGRGSRCHFHERAQSVPSGDDRRGAPERPRGPRPPIRGSRSSACATRARPSTSAARPSAACTASISTSRPGETVGLVGESGSGKTTLARVIIGLTAPDDGAEVELDGHPVASLAPRRSTADQKALQIVFQNPDSALNRRHSVRRLISRSLSKLGGYSGDQLKERLLALVKSVRLPERYLPMRPSQLSGGLKQRVAIARAFAGDPRIVICDEPTSALDVSVQAAILNLLTDLQRREDVAYLFISHDLGVVRYLADRIVVLYLGRVMEVGPAERVFGGPQHPYTEALLQRRPDAGRSGPPADPAGGRDPQRRRSADGLPVSHPLPAQDRRDLRDHRARAARGGGRSRDPLPHPAGRAAPASGDRRLSRGRASRAGRHVAAPRDRRRPPPGRPRRPARG